jgi:hypothetical protein
VDRRRGMAQPFSVGVSCVARRHMQRRTLAALLVVARGG